jgi:hypothetical protein
MWPNDDSFNEGEWRRTTLTEGQLNSTPECKAWDVQDCNNGQTAFKEVIKTLYNQADVDYIFQNTEPDAPQRKAHLTHKWARTQ